MAKISMRATSLEVKVSSAIVTVRGQRVILDASLAGLYGTTTKRLNEQVRRNLARFPEDFVFRLSAEEATSLNWSQIATSSQKHRRRNQMPFAFTEHGAIQAANVLSSPRAVEMSVFVVRAFVRLRSLVAAHADLARRIDELEARVNSRLGGQDESIAEILAAIRTLTSTATKPRRGMGFTADV